MTNSRAVIWPLVAGLIAISGLMLVQTGQSFVATLDLNQPHAASIAAVRTHRLTHSSILTEKTLAPRATCPASIVSYYSDGLKEYALAQRPPHTPPAHGYPVVIFAHGYTDPRTYHTDNTQYATMLSWYCQHGYLVMKPDYRGVGQSQGIASNGIYAPGDTYDVLNLAAALATYPLADHKHIALVGHSMGGAVVLRAGVANHGLGFRAIITIAGAVDSLPAMTSHWTGKIPPDVAIQRRQVITAEGPPGQNSAYWHDSSAINYVHELKAPLQIHHGLADATVPASFSTNLDLALTTAKKTHEYYTYPATGHLFGNPIAMQELLQRSTAFLDRYNR